MLRGLREQKVKLIPGKELPKAMAKASHLYMLHMMPQQLPFPKSQDFMVQQLSLEKEEIPLVIAHLLQQFDDLFQDPQGLPPSRGVYDHRIPLKDNAKPVNIRPYRYPLKQKDIIEQLVQDMLDSGIIQPSSNPFTSPVVLVSKKDGTSRLCVDYKELNNQTIKDKFPIPLVEKLMDELAGSRIFNKIDLKAGYHQLRVAEEHVFKTAFKTHSGHFEFLVMPFGLTNAPATFQSLMNHIFRPYLRKFVLVFFDDILVYSSSSLQQHVSHLSLVFSVIRDHSLVAKKSKCTFGISRVEYLGHYVSAEGISTDPKKVEVVQKWPTPTTVKELRSFLGLARYYRKFMKGHALIAKPLTQLLKKGEFYWGPEVDLAFHQLKQALTSAPVLALPNFSQPFVCLLYTSPSPRD